MMVTTRVDISRPVSKRMKKDFETKECVENLELSQTWVDFKDVLERSFDKMTAHYGVDMRELTSKYSPRYSKYYKK